VVVVVVVAVLVVVESNVWSKCRVMKSKGKERSGLSISMPGPDTAVGGRFTATARPALGSSRHTRHGGILFYISTTSLCPPAAHISFSKTLQLPPLKKRNEMKPEKHVSASLRKRANVTRAQGSLTKFLGSLLRNLEVSCQPDTASIGRSNPPDVRPTGCVRWTHC
jgi:hypothetical protein